VISAHSGVDRSVEGLLASLAVTDPDGLFNRQDKNLSFAQTTGIQLLLDHIHHFGFQNHQNLTAGMKLWNL
jgi:hypothetical protein